MTNGRPIRFVAVALLGWTTLRAVALWPTLDPVALVGGRADAEPAPAGRSATMLAEPAQALPSSRSGDERASGMISPAAVAAKAAAALPQSASPPVAPPAAEAPVIPPPTAPSPLATSPSRFAASAWLIARGGADTALLGGQLGASQAGLRVTYALGEGRRLALAARVAAPLSGKGREAAVGIDWQPTRLPLHLIAEQRLSLDGGRGGPTLLAVGGINPTRIAPHLQVEGYAQVGAIARDRVEGFADGAARLTAPIVEANGWRLDAGAGAWGGAQRGAARLDVGPSIGLVVPVADRRLRLTADWRQRVAGGARPGSGPALSIGSDF